MVVRDFTKFVKEHFAETSNLIGVEVGVWKGDNARIIKDYLNPKLLILVDAWNECIEAGGMHLVVDVERGCEDRGETQEKHLLYTYQKFADSTDVIIVRGLSHDVTKLLSGCFDFVYIDADHGYESVKRDIECWYPLVREDGIFGGHDYHMDGVAKAVDEVFPTEELFIGRKDNSNAIDWWVII